MELNKFVVLVGNSLSKSHGISITRAGVGGSATEIGSAVATSRKNCVLGADAMNASVFHVESHDSDALLSVLAHEEIQTKIFDEVSRVKGQRTSVESVQHGVSGSV